MGLVLLQVKSMEASEPVTLSSPPINPVPRRASARLVQSSSAAVQNIAGAMSKALNMAGTEVAVKAVKAGEAARSRGVGCTPGGTSKAKSAAKSLAPAIPAIRSKQGEKAEPKKAAAAAVTSKEQTAAAAGAGASMPQGDGDQQEAQGCGGVVYDSVMVIAPHHLQFVSPMKLAPKSGRTHCNRLCVPKHVIGWYPDIQHGSPLHLQVKVPAAAEELALRGGTCSIELGETRTSVAPAEEAPLIIGGGAQNPVHMKLLSTLVGTLAAYECAKCFFVGPHQSLDHFIGWRIVCMHKVGFSLYMV